MASLLFHEQIEDIRALTHTPGYVLLTPPCGLVQLARPQGNTWKTISPPLPLADMRHWLTAYLAGLEDGYMTAKRGH